MKRISIEQQNDAMPGCFQVGVIMQQSTSTNPWLDYEWKAIGVATCSSHSAGPGQPRLIHESDESRQYLLEHFSIRLYKDEVESYYHNLVSPHPACYVVASTQDDAMPEPFLVSLSYDEAHAYLEGDEDIFVVDMPPEIYRWLEVFVLTYYAPEKRKKRKRQDWKNQSGQPGG